MPFMPLMTAGIETALNKLLWQDKALRAARQRLYGKVLRIILQELNAPLVMVFSEQQLDVVAQWDGEVDCTVVTRLSVLPSLQDRSQLTRLIRQGILRFREISRWYRVWWRYLTWLKLTRQKCWLPGREMSSQKA